MKEPPTILIVDDEPFNVDCLQQELEDLGYATLGAASGREAMEKARAECPDLILLDIMMPGMSGYEVLERLRADERLRDVPVIMVSALNEIDSVVRCIELGAEDYLGKPYNPTLLRARIGASLEKKRLRDEVRATRDRLEAELQSARDVQLGMVPSDFRLPVEAGHFEIYATLQPARQVGGDLYDFFCDERGRLFFVVADVSDKGAPAALFMARTKTMIRMVATLCRDGEGAPLPPDQIVGRVNAELCRDNGQGMFVTMFFAMLDPATGWLAFCNAGHNLPYVVGREGSVQVLDGARGKPLGIRSTFSYETATRQFAPGDCVFLYTDGITEAMNPAGEWYSEPRLEDALRGHAGRSAREVVDGVIAHVRDFVAAAPQADDIAALAVHCVCRYPNG